MASGLNRATNVLQTISRISFSQPKRFFRRPIIGSPFVKIEWRKEDGDIVRKNVVLRKQKNLKFHPGLNVELRKDLNLYSMVDGQVMITKEKVNPKPGNPLVERYYNEIDQCILYKYYYHVIPKPQEKKFKLVDFV